MNKKAVLLTVLVISLVVLAGCSSQKNSNFNEQKLNDVSNLGSGVDTNLKSSGDTSSGNALVELTPDIVVDGLLHVEIAVNTHSVNLNDFDLKKSTILQYGEKVVHPIKAPQLSGHHNLGDLVFEVDEPLSDFTITINGIPNIEQRVFTWNK